MLAEPITHSFMYTALHHDPLPSLGDLALG